jgi:hypothetical protein
MSETVASSSAASITIRASCRDSESARTQAVEPGSEFEGFVASRGGCSEFVAEIQLSHIISVRNGAGIENNQMSLSGSSVLNEEQVLLPQGNDGFSIRNQTKVAPRRFVLWRGWQQSNGGVGGRGDSDNEAESFFPVALAYSMASNLP